MERGCETEHSSRKMQMLRDQWMEEAAVLSPCTKAFSSSIRLARSCSPQRLFLIANVNSTAREWKSFRTTCFVGVWFAFFFFFKNVLRDDANQIPNESRNRGQEAVFFGLLACKCKKKKKKKVFRKLQLAASSHKMRSQNL